MLLEMLTDDLIAKGKNANLIIQEIAKEINGGGGGQPFFATAGGTKSEGISKALNKSKDIFLSYCVDDISTIEAMKNTQKKFNYLIDPHTAVASEAVERISENIQGKAVILSTAHPAKFPEVIKNANLTLKDIPNSLSVIFDNEERAYNFPASKDLIFDFIIKNNS